MSENQLYLLALAFVTLGLSALLPSVLHGFLKRRKLKKKITRLANNAVEMTPRAFFQMRNTCLSGKDGAGIAAQRNFPGVYILLNKTKRMYYVGQGAQVLNRVNDHFTGRGNGDVYADYKYGDDFTIRIIALKDSGFSSLNELERNAIWTYQAYEKGYNKTKGNR